METYLGFGKDQKNIERTAKFQSIEQKNEYVSAEISDIRCQDAFFNAHRTRESKDRKDAIEKMHITRFNFFISWREKNYPELIPRVNPPNDGISA